MAAALFPIFADLRDRPVLVVGGGTVARRKAEALLAAGAHVRVGATRLEPVLAQLAAQGRIEAITGVFEDGWVDGVWLVVAATADQSVNHRVAAAASARRVWANVVDDAAASMCHVPACIQRGPLQIAVSSGGGAPMLARHVRRRIEALLDESIGRLAELLARKRERIRRRHPDLSARRRFVERLLAGSVPRLLRQAQPAAAEAAFEAALLADAPHPAGGSVVLVGAGPGDPDLLTLRAARALDEADVILYDRLVNPGILARARRDAERIAVGKQAGGHSVAQAQIHALMLEHARAGRRVVRLKGGDPFVFGRGGEELEFLRAHGIPYEAVPGITAALACAAYAGVPLTHRHHAQAVTFVTAHCAGSLDRLDWAALARARHTLAVYMGVAGLERVCAQLVAHGRAPDTPCALIENGSLPQQRVVHAGLTRLASLARARNMRSPSLLIVGEVAGLAPSLAWFGIPPIEEANPVTARAHAVVARSGTRLATMR